MSLQALFGGNPEQQGLLAAAAQILHASGPSRMPTSLGQILGGGYMAGQQATFEAQQRAALEQARRMQLEEAQLDLTAKKDARARQQQIDGFARDSFRTAGQQASSLPGGPTVANAARIGDFQDGFDVETFLNKVSAVAPLQAMEYRKMFAKSGPKFDAGLTFVNGPDGRPVAVRTADDGSVKQIAGLSPREKLHFLNTGSKTLGVNEYTGEQGAAFNNSVSPDAQLSSWTQQRGQNMTDARSREANDVNRMGQRTQIVNDPVQGPMLVDKGTGQARPVMMNGQAVSGENTAKRAAAAKNLIPLIDQAEGLIKGATGSYLGAAHDQTARLFGRATDGAQNIAQLRVLEGNIMMAQPRMEGPQSNMDVELYRQMAAQLGDPTVPNATKKAALGTLRTLYQKYDSGNSGKQNQGGGVPSDIGALLDKYGGY